MKSLAEKFPNSDEITIEPEVEEIEEVIEEPAEEVAEPEVSGLKFGKVIGGSLNLRKGPSTDSEVILVLPEDTLVHFKGEKEEVDGFVKVKVEEFIVDGYVMDKFIEWDEE